MSVCNVILVDCGFCLLLFVSLFVGCVCVCLNLYMLSLVFVVFCVMFS